MFFSKTVLFGAAVPARVVKHTIFNHLCPNLYIAPAHVSLSVSFFHLHVCPLRTAFCHKCLFERVCEPIHTARMCLMHPRFPPMFNLAERRAERTAVRVLAARGDGAHSEMPVTRYTVYAHANTHPHTHLLCAI